MNNSELMLAVNNQLSPRGLIVKNVRDAKILYFVMDDVKALLNDQGTCVKSYDSEIEKRRYRILMDLAMQDKIDIDYLKTGGYMFKRKDGSVIDTLSEWASGDTYLVEFSEYNGLKMKVSCAFDKSPIFTIDGVELEYAKAGDMCPHCGRSGAGGTFARWHFDNCKYKVK